MTYDKDYFIKKFEAIPEDKWITDAFTDPFDGSKHCALGHCGEEAKKVTDEGLFLAKLFTGGKQGVALINDGVGIFDKYGSTPKQRILHALRLLP